MSEAALRVFVSQAKELVDFYRSGAAKAPPRRVCDESRWYHRVLVALHLLAALWVALLVAEGAAVSGPHALTAGVFACFGHKVVDPVNGIVHFALDNYFRRSTPVIGGVVGNFLDHHETPSTISRIQFARNVAALVAVSLPVLALLIVVRPTETLAGVATLGFFGTFFVETGFSMEPHKYAHMSQRELPPALRWLQRRGWLVPARVHAKHHARTPGHPGHYASVSGKSNRYLTSAVFRRAERAIYELTERLTGSGIEPRSWLDSAIRNS